ncbi:MAG TPA: heavy-metal-associated domain-containing protein [Thermoanaerobaculia bacterium]|nr:heavy-metal-associated domain-containing protein [Thermoanaerobaculia bacterium]
MKTLFLLLLSFAAALPLQADTKTVTFAVQGWTCGSCAAATRIALKKLEGVEDVRTDIQKMEATVTYDDSKVSPEKMLPAIARLGYKATVRTGGSSASLNGSEKNAALKAQASAERVSFFEVPLECGAADGLGCGSASKPVLKALERDSRVKEAKINHAGTTLAVVWSDPEQAVAGAATVESAFKRRDLDVTLLRGEARDRALKDYGSGRWYGASEVDRLSEREAHVIATRVINRAHLDLDPGKLAALNQDLSAGIAAVLTRDKGEECARDPLEELTKVASKHLTGQQMAQLRKAAERGAGALPGETR